MPKKISRKQAMADGLTRYFTGVACRNGHIAERYTKTKQCIPCNAAHGRRRREAADPKFQSLKNREAILKHRYGITLPEYAQMVERQLGRCGICRNIAKDLLVDHCHDTDKVRGLLCSNCNSLIGFANDNPAILELAIQYLTTHA